MDTTTGLGRGSANAASTEALELRASWRRDDGSRPAGSTADVPSSPRTEGPDGLDLALARTAELASAAIENAFLSKLQELIPTGFLAVELRGLRGPSVEVARDPGSLEARGRFLARLEGLTSEIRVKAGALARTRAELHGRSLEAVRRVNALLGDLAGGRVSESRVAAQELASLIGISLSFQDDAAVLRIGGLDLEVRAERTGRIEIAPSVGAGDPRRLVLCSAGARRPLARPYGGALGSLLELRDCLLPGWSVALDRIAVVLRDELNALHGHAGASGLDGYLGGDLVCGDGACELTLALTGPRSLAIDGDGTRPPRNLLAIAELADRPQEGLEGASLVEMGAQLAGSIRARRERALAVMGSGVAPSERSVASAVGNEGESCSS